MISTLNLNREALKELETSEKEPFYKQRFQWIKVLAGTYYHMHAYVFFKLISKICSLFSDHLSKYFQSQAIKHDQKVSRLFILLDYRSRLIDFSINGTSTIRENASNQEEEHAAIQRHYQLQDLNWEKSGLMAIEPSRLKQLDTQQGCCAGISSHFILCYLNQIQSGKSPFEAIHKIAPLYADEIPKTAEIAQIFQRATEIQWPDLNYPIRPDYPSFPEPSSKAYDLPIILADLIEIAVSPITGCFNLLYGLISNNTSKIQSGWLIRNRLDPYSSENSRKIWDEYNQRLKKYEKEVEVYTKQAAERRHPKNFPSGSQLILGLTVEERFESSLEKMKSNESKKGLTELVQTLPNGVYDVGLNGERSGHALVLIKTDQQNYFLFDPNSGTIVSDQNQMGKDLWDIANSLYLQSEGSCSIRFYKCKLK
jgi:hypothetical protein